MNTFGLIGLTEENVGIDRRFYTGLTSTNGTFAVSYNAGRVDVFLNGIKLVGNHTGNTNYDYTMDATTGTGSSITLATGVALVSADVVECIGYVSNSSNTVTSYNPTPASGDGGWNVFINITHTASDLVNVFLNGVLLDDSDYTLDASNNKVTIGGATLTASDVVVIQVIGALDHSNFVPASGGTFTGNVSFGDNNKAQFGASNDLQIYHDGSHSLITEAGTGALKLKGDDIRLEDVSGNNIIKAVGSGSAELYESGSKKLETTSTGIEVTGNVKLSANGGINFSAYATSGNPSSNLLDDYEEGTWTPVLTSSGGGSTSSGTIYGRYIKIGRMVYAFYNFEGVTTSGLTNRFKITGLPFNSGSTAYIAHTDFATYNVSFSSSRTQLFHLVPGDSYLLGGESRSGDSWTEWAPTNTSNVYFRGTITYLTG